MRAVAPAPPCRATEDLWGVGQTGIPSGFQFLLPVASGRRYARPVQTSQTRQVSDRFPAFKTPSHWTLLSAGCNSRPASGFWSRRLSGLGAVLVLTMVRGAEFHVSPAGADTNPGTAEQPLATLEAAREAMRRLKAGGGLPPGGVTIWFHGGDYVRSNALELTAADSGTPKAPVVWRARPGEIARLLGGRQLPTAGLWEGSAAAAAPAEPKPRSGGDWILPGVWRPVSDPAVRARLAEAARDRVRQFDLRAAGLSEFGEMKSRGFGRSTAPAHCELFFNGRPMTLARWPNEGEFARIAGFPDAGAQDDEHGGKIGRLENGFYYEGDRPGRWHAPDDLWVHGYWAWDWANSYERVASLDRDRRLVKTAPPHGLYGFRKGQRFYFLNVLEELDQPGEWYLDRRAGVLYFWPPDAQVEQSSKDPRPAELLLSLLAQPLVRLTDAAHVSFQGLVFEATRGNAIEIHGGASNRVLACILRNVGNWAVVVRGGTGHGVAGCDVYDTGDGGVDLQGGDRQTLTPAGHFVEDCHFARQGRWSKCYVPAVHLGGVGLRAAHNRIHDHPHCAILFGGNDHLIEFNEIHHVALETGDVGAIYTGRDYTYRGNRIRYNFIHHTGGVGMGSMGVYMDDCVSGTEILGNLFLKVQRAAFLGGGRDHRVINNVFVDCRPAVELDGRGLDRSPVWRNMVDRTMRERLRAVPAVLYRERYPELKSLDAWYGPPEGPALEGEAFKGVPPEGNVVARNICVGPWLNVYWHARPEMLHLENNWTNAAAFFARLPGDSAQAADLVPVPDSPVWQQGFERIPVERIGPRAAGWRRERPGSGPVSP